MALILQLSGASSQKMSFGQAYESTKGITLRLLLLTVAIGLVTLLGLLLLVIPGILFATWYSMAPYVMVEEKLGIGEALKRSKALAKGRFFEVAAVLFFPSAVSLLIFIPIIGLIVLIPLSVMYQAALAIRYLQLKQYKDSNQQLPPVHPLNYAVFVLGLIGTGAGVMADRPDGGLMDPQTGQT